MKTKEWSLKVVETTDMEKHGVILEVFKNSISTGALIASRNIFMTIGEGGKLLYNDKAVGPKILKNTRKKLKDNIIIQMNLLIMRINNFSNDLIPAEKLQESFDVLEEIFVNFDDIFVFGI